MFFENTNKKTIDPLSASQSMIQGGDFLAAMVLKLNKQHQLGNVGEINRIKERLVSAGI